MTFDIESILKCNIKIFDIDFGWQLLKPGQYWFWYCLTFSLNGILILILECKTWSRPPLLLRSKKVVLRKMHFSLQTELFNPSPKLSYKLERRGNKFTASCVHLQRIQRSLASLRWLKTHLHWLTLLKVVTFGRERESKELPLQGNASSYKLHLIWYDTDSFPAM